MPGFPAISTTRSFRVLWLHTHWNIFISPGLLIFVDYLSQFLRTKLITLLFSYRTYWKLKKILWTFDLKHQTVTFLICRCLDTTCKIFDGHPTDGWSSIASPRADTLSEKNCRRMSQPPHGVLSPSSLPRIPGCQASHINHAYLGIACAKSNLDCGGLVVVHSWDLNEKEKNRDSKILKY